MEKHATRVVKNWSPLGNISAKHAWYYKCQCGDSDTFSTDADAIEYARLHREANWTPETVEAHSKLGHDVVADWDVPYTHSTELSDDGVLVVQTWSGKILDGGGDTTFKCRDCGYMELALEDLDVDYD